MRRFTIAVSIALFSLYFMPGCATAPVQEMSDARQAIQAAQAAGAEHSATNEYQDAQRLLDQAEKQLNQHQYRNARRTALSARERAIQSREIAQESAISPENP
jgi:predicted S18 family serine protease